MQHKVLFLLDTLAPIGGAERLAVDIAVALKSSGKFVPTFCSTRYGGSLEKKLAEHGIKFFLLERRRSFEVGKFRKLIKFLKEERVEIIHSHLLGSNFWAGVIGRLARVPIVVVHNHGESYNSKVKISVNKLIGILADQIIFISQYEMSTFIKRIGCAPDKCVTIYNGIKEGDYNNRPIDDMKISLGISSTNHVIGIVAAFRPEKDHRTFLLAAREVLKRIGGVTFLLVGDGKTKKDMEKFASDLGISENCLFAGFQEEISGFLSIMDIGCLSSIREGIPLSILEYMAFSLPIVATSVGGVPEVVEDGINGFTVQPKDHNAMAERIIDMLDNEELRMNMGSRGHSILEQNFTQERMVENIEGLYFSLLQRNAKL